MTIPESDVLKPVDPSITNSDDWEIFVLDDARVVHESNGKPANLLSAYADTPLKVQGTLKGPSRGQAKYFLQKPYKPVEIEIRNVTRFSYGEMTDGAHVIWAQGQAGWFEIQPTATYKNIHGDMVQAVELLYFITDIYSGVRKKAGGPSPQLIFQEYAEDTRFPCTDPSAAKQIFEKHRNFLLMCFLNKAQGIGWSTTPIYQYYRRYFPQDFDTCKARIEGRFTQPQAPKQARTSKSPPNPQSAVRNKTKLNVGKSVDQKVIQTPKKNDNWWEASTLFEFMQKAVNQRALRAGRNQITLERVAQLIVKRYEIEELETAQNVLLVHAQNLCYMMDHPRRKNIQFFASEPIYQQLAAGHNLSAVEQRRSEGVELRPRKDHGTLKNEESASSNTSDDEEESIRTPVRRPPDKRRKGRLSVLRPKSGKYSGKSKGKGLEQGSRVGGKGKAPVPNFDASEDESQNEDSEQSTSSDEDMEIDTPTQAVSPGREKRKLDETEVDEGEDQTRRKRAASTSLTPESPPTTGESDDEILAKDGTVPALPLRYRPSNQPPSSILPIANTTPGLAPTLVSTPLPTYAANASRDSWICNFDGCTQRIYGCSKVLGQQLIKEHLEDHSRGREKVVGILWREQDKLNLPVSNLIKKIREMSEASAPLFPAAEKAVPRPIQRPV